MADIMAEVNHVKKIYRLNIKEPGIKGAFRNLAHAKWTEKTALDDISFQMKEGQALACIGENGAGKSTLIKIMIGILTPTAGDVTVYGGHPRESGKEYLRKIGVVFGQKSNLWTDLPVEESYQAVKTLYRLDPGEYKKNYDMIVQLLELAPILSSPARKLSLGQRMKADSGMAFLHSHRLLYLDEPTIGLDINIKHTIRSFLRQMNQEKGVSIFLTSHDLDDIDEICDDAIVLSGGKLFYNGSLDALKQQYVHERSIRVTGVQKSDIRKYLPDARISREGRVTRIDYPMQAYGAETVLNAVSQAFDIEDISIQAPDIDTVVSHIFSREKEASAL